MRPLEKILIQKLDASLSEFKGRMQSLGVTYTAPRLQVRNPSEAAYESELSIDFFRGKNLVDAIEFHVFRGGAPVAELDSFDQWLQGVLTDVVNRQGPDGPPIKVPHP